MAANETTFQPLEETSGILMEGCFTGSREIVTSMRFKPDGAHVRPETAKCRCVDEGKAGGPCSVSEDSLPTRQGIFDRASSNEQAHYLELMRHDPVAGMVYLDALGRQQQRAPEP